MSKPKRPDDESMSIVEQLIEGSTRALIDEALAKEGRPRAIEHQSVEALLAILEEEGEEVRRSAEGASDAAIAKLEAALGFRLPEGYASLLRRIAYFEVANVNVLGIAPDDDDFDVVHHRQLLNEELRLFESENADDPRARRFYAAVRELVALVWIGPNWIPFGSEALFIDSRGRYFRFSNDDFLARELPKAEPESFDFERYLIEHIEDQAL